MSAKSKFILLHPKDNVFVCTTFCKSGEKVSISGNDIILDKDITVGHKVAGSTLAAGEKVFKCGAPIGSMIEAVNCGDHVHMHNLKSDYLASHLRTATGEQDA
ncbi:MAG: UxaA family hydrolase [Kordiimonadaceae bacterium]|jgi:(2R)-sulfolactate sulfo-lyase subunit alpha|nr:UxaA family hydrolase [Kordiimonadaceae bacterium]MBT6031528.1 UxaA family hydrolase [Kordiimonadaceae bacterium]